MWKFQVCSATLRTAVGDAPELYCQRCPSLQSATDYVVLLVAVSSARRHCKSGLQLLPVTTSDVTPPTFLSSASASNVQESNFTLTVSMNEPGTLCMMGTKGVDEQVLLPAICTHNQMSLLTSYEGSYVAPLACLLYCTSL